MRFTPLTSSAIGFMSSEDSVIFTSSNSKSLLEQWKDNSFIFKEEFDWACNRKNISREDRDFISRELRKRGVDIRDSEIDIEELRVSRLTYLESGSHIEDMVDYVHGDSNNTKTRDINSYKRLDRYPPSNNIHLASDKFLSVSISDKRLKVLKKAMLGLNLVRFNYTRITDGVSTPGRVVELYDIKRGKGGRSGRSGEIVVWAYDVSKNDRHIRKFYLSRVANPSILRRTYRPRWDVSIESSLNRRIGDI